jgi:hypothetical protein
MSLTFYAGQTVRASQLIKLVPLQVIRGTSQTIINTTTLADDAILFFTGLPPSTTYKMFSKIIYQSSTTADFKLGWSCSGTGATLTWSQGTMDSTSTVAQSPINHTALTLADNGNFGGVSAAGTGMTGRPEGTLFTGTGAAITFKFRWAQNTLDNVNGTSLGAGSEITLVQIP